MTTDLLTRLADAQSYEDFAIRSGGFAIPLPGRGQRGKERPFWSKGWMGCHFNCGKAVDNWKHPLIYRRVVRDGVITEGWYCK